MMAKQFPTLIFIYFCCCLVITCTSINAEEKPCIQRYYNKNSSFVCVCNSTYCDTVTSKTPQSGNAIVYTSSSSSLRFAQSSLKLKQTINLNDNDLTISILTSEKFQSIKGFGAAVTDAACYNIMKLSKGAQNNLLFSYFSKSGIEYNMARIPIASCDFSLRQYTYLEKPNDFNLTSFSLVEEDVKVRIPILKRMIQASARNLSFYGSPWTAPAWMKSNKKEAGWGWLLGKPGDKYHKTWAQYFVKYLDAYKKNGIDFWGLTMQNEPSNGLVIKAKWQSTGWTPQTERDFIKLDLGPALHNGGYGDVKLMVLDDQRLFLPAWPSIIMQDPEAAKYVSGVGVHWYWNWLVGPEVLDKTHNENPNLFILGTEACNSAYVNGSSNWEDGEKYSQDILDTLNNWGVGWVDWNMCLDLKGGPRWSGGYDASPIFVNTTGDEFYKVPMFYHMGHFSKFIPEGSVRVKSSANIKTELQYVSVIREDNTIVVVMLNKTPNDIKFNVNINSNKAVLQSTIPANSIQTYLLN